MMKWKVRDPVSMKMPFYSERPTRLEIELSMKSRADRKTNLQPSYVIAGTKRRTNEARWKEFC